MEAEVSTPVVVRESFRVAYEGYFFKLTQSKYIYSSGEALYSQSYQFCLTDKNGDIVQSGSGSSSDITRTGFTYADVSEICVDMVLRYITEDA